MKRYRGTMIHEITANDIGRGRIVDRTGRTIWLAGIMGRIQLGDIGKRMYRYREIVSVENDAQLTTRLAEVS